MENKYEKVNDKWVIKEEYIAEPKTKVIQKVWQEQGLDGSVIDCCTEINVPIDHEEITDKDIDEIKPSYMKSLKMGDLIFDVNDYSYVELLLSNERYYTRGQLNNIAIRYDVSYKSYSNKKLLYDAILKAWNDYFETNTSFKDKYHEMWTYD